MISAIALIIVLVLGLLAFMMAETEERHVRYIFFGLLLMWLILYTGVVVESVRTIPAIEVYRGNTTLHVTYQDGVPVDSVVVIKEK